MAANLKTLYDNTIRKSLQEKFGYKNPMEVPELKKICVNMGVGADAVSNPKTIEFAVNDLSLITGQRPVVTKARKSIATFKLRAGMPIGCMVTLRGDRMYEFLERFVNSALPRVRDFRGLSSKGFDGMGNYSMGLKEQIIFPEIEYDKIDMVRGMDISFVTSANNDEAAKELLKGFNMPFVR